MDEKEIAAKRLKDYTEFLKRYSKDLTPEQIDEMLDTMNRDKIVSEQ